MTDDSPDAVALAEKGRTLRTLCLGLILFGCVLITGVASTVQFALGGGPVVKGRGVQVLLGVGAVLTLTAVAVAVVLVPVLTRSGLRKIATTPPDPPEDGVPPDTDGDRLWRVYAQGKFVEYGLADAAAIATAVLYHLSADWLMLVFVGGMVLYQVVVFPTAARTRAWVESARSELARLKGPRPE